MNFLNAGIILGIVLFITTQIVIRIDTISVKALKTLYGLLRIGYFVEIALAIIGFIQLFAS